MHTQTHGIKYHSILIQQEIITNFMFQPLILFSITGKTSKLENTIPILWRECQTKELSFALVNKRNN